MVKCKFCGVETMRTATQLCERCFELARGLDHLADTNRIAYVNLIARLHSGLSLKERA
jgi:hypothetical protein